MCGGIALSVIEISRPSQLQVKDMYVVIRPQTKHNLAMNIPTLQSSGQIVVRRSEDCC